MSSDWVQMKSETKSSVGQADVDAVDVNQNTSDSQAQEELGSTLGSAPASCLGSGSTQSMAFIIAFDDEKEQNCSKKMLNIKDSIRQFAPPKPDSIEKPRPQKTATEPANKCLNNKSLAMKKSPTTKAKSLLKSSSTPSASHTPLNDCDLKGSHLSESANYLIQRMLYSEAVDEHNKMPPINNSNNHPVVRNEFEDEVNSRKERISDCCSKLSPVKEKSSPSNSGEKDSGLSDDKSESGTYTVGVDQKDPDLEEARKKIDEIFGVFEAVGSPFNASPTSESSSPHQTSLNGAQAIWQNHFDKPVRTQDSPLFTRKYNTDVEQLSCSLKSPTNTSTFTRSKRKLPQLPPPQMTQSDSEPFFQKNLRQNMSIDLLHSNNLSNINSNHANFNRNQSSLYNNNTNSSTHKTSHSNGLWINNNATPPVSVSHSAPNCLPSPLVLRKTPTAPQAARNPLNHSFEHRRNKSWGNSNSDVDQCDSCSFNSDESTDPSTRSSNSALSKNNGNLSSSSAPSKMRFNRAFALRRARLGIETPGIPLDTNRGKDKTKAPSVRDKPPIDFNRNDGGRFSLRLPQSSTSSSRKLASNNDSNIRMIVKQEIPKFPLHRKGSDPNVSKGINGSRASFKGAFSDTEKSVVNRTNSPLIQAVKLNSLKKSASFAESNGIDSKPKNTENCTRGLSTFQMGKRLFSTRPLQKGQIDSIRNIMTPAKPDVMSLSMNSSSPQHAPKPDMMSISMNASLYRSPESPSSPSKTSPQHHNKPSREISALDSLVVSAINQLSQKLRSNVLNVLQRERSKHAVGNEARVMIDEILPQVSSPERRLIDNNDNNISRDLSNILKNLKKVEQSFEVISMLLDPNTIRRSDGKLCKNSSGFFIVDV